ncbi:MAG: hypothetical protein M1830_002626 [Pleopsidium flavum]|nr:MAG: hypothetical protein M1830_002626 [Pleopsidium flavum]
MPAELVEVSTTFGSPNRQAKARDQDEDYGLVTGVNGLKVAHTYSLRVMRGQEVQAVMTFSAAVKMCGLTLACLEISSPKLKKSPDISLRATT